MCLLSERRKQMTKEAKQTKIIESIKARGWFTKEVYFNEAKDLLSAGIIKSGERYFTGGNLKPVWVAA
jgi:hypothetical protein